MAQRVIIPKGLVNPNETTVVEIPAPYKNVGTVVARIKGSESSGHEPRTPSPRTMKKRTIRRRTAPHIGPHNVEPRGEGYTFGGRDNLEESMGQQSYRGFKPSNIIDVPPNPPPNWRCSRPLDYGEELSYRDFGPAHSSSRRDPQELSYRDFRPDAHSSPSSRARHQSTPCQVMKKTSVTRTSPTEYSQEETEESYYDESSGLSSSGPMFDMSSGSSGGYQQFSGVGDDSGGYQAFSGIEPSNMGSPQVSGDQMSQMLSQIESQEQEQIMRDMSVYQEARRKLLFDASSLASAADVSARLIGSHTM